MSATPESSSSVVGTGFTFGFSVSCAGSGQASASVLSGPNQGAPIQLVNSASGTGTYTGSGGTGTDDVNVVLTTDWGGDARDTLSHTWTPHSATLSIDGPTGPSCLNDGVTFVAIASWDGDPAQGIPVEFSDGCHV